MDEPFPAGLWRAEAGRQIQHPRGSIMRLRPRACRCGQVHRRRAAILRGGQDVTAPRPAKTGLKSMAQHLSCYLKGRISQARPKSTCDINFKPSTGDHLVSLPCCQPFRPTEAPLPLLWLVYIYFQFSKPCCR